MNELRPHPNESNPEDIMTKKCLKELKVVHLPFWWFNHRNSMIKRASFRAILCLVTS